MWQGEPKRVSGTESSGGKVWTWIFRVLAYVNGYPERIRLVYSPEIGESVVYDGEWKVKHSGWFKKTGISISDMFGDITDARHHLLKVRGDPSFMPYGFLSTVVKIAPDGTVNEELISFLPWEEESGLLFYIDVSKDGRLKQISEPCEVTKDGTRFKQILESDSSSGNLARDLIEIVYHMCWPVFCNKEIRIGESWADKEYLGLSIGKQEWTIMDSKYTLINFIKRDGYKCGVIGFEKTAETTILPEEDIKDGDKDITGFLLGKVKGKIIYAYEMSKVLSCKGKIFLERISRRLNLWENTEEATKLKLNFRLNGV